MDNAVDVAAKLPAGGERSGFAALRDALRATDLSALDGPGYRAINRRLRALKDPAGVRIAYLGNVTLDLLPPFAAAFKDDSSPLRKYLNANTTVSSGKRGELYTVFGGTLVAVTLAFVPATPVAALVSQGINELLFPVGCSLVLFSAGALGERISPQRDRGD